MRAATPSTDDQLLGSELDRLARKIDDNRAERRRLADLYQSGLLELSEVQRRAHDIDSRHDTLASQRDQLIAQRQQLASENRLQQRVSDFARRAAARHRQTRLPTAPTTTAPYRGPRERHRLARRDPPAHPPRRGSPADPPESNWRPHYGRRRRTARPPRSDEDDAGSRLYRECPTKTVCDPFVGPANVCYVVQLAQSDPAFVQLFKDLGPATLSVGGRTGDKQAMRSTTAPASCIYQPWS